MPIVSVFFGIVIRIYHADHNPPHFHASYGEHDAIIEISTGTLLDGSLPPRARKLVEEWRRLNQKPLQTAWIAATAFKAPKRIRGLE